MNPTDSPLAKRMWRAASMHEESARILLGSTRKGTYSPMTTLSVYLSGYIVECSMKAILLCRTPFGSNGRNHYLLYDQFREKVKHNLELLRKLLDQKGIRLHGDKYVWLRNIINEWQVDLRYCQLKRKIEYSEAVESFTSATNLSAWLRKQV